MKNNQPKVGAGVVIIKDGKTLLAKRQGSHSSGMWGTMGGHVEFGESPIETVKREAKEELGIEVGNIQFVACTNIIKDNHHYLDVSFTADIVSGKPTIMEPERIKEIGWYDLGNLPSPLFEPVKTVLDAIKSGKNYFEVNKKSS